MVNPRAVAALNANIARLQEKIESGQIPEDEVEQATQSIADLTENLSRWADRGE